MKKIIYILSVMLFAFFSCTDEVDSPDQGGNVPEGWVRVNFVVNDLPEFKVLTRAGGETSVETLSLMPFNGEEFLGRVEAELEETSVDDITGKAQGKGYAVVPKETTKIHFVANYDWKDKEYIKPAGEIESSLMSSLVSGTDNLFVAWGTASVSPGDDMAAKTVQVDLLRNYAKVTVESDIEWTPSVEKGGGTFVVGGFALANYANKGTVVAPDAEDDLNIAAGMELINQTATDCLNTEPKYMYEYANGYDNQTCVIIKKKDLNQYYKIQLTDADGNPYLIQRNVVYKVIIKYFAEDSKGSSTFEDALKSAPTNSIIVEVMKDAPTVSDKQKNRLTVDPVYNVFTSSGYLTFNAKYLERGTTLNNSKISISLIDNGHQSTSILPEFSESTVMSVGPDGNVTTSVNVPSGLSALDSATLLVKAGVLSRIVTVFISKQYEFDAQESTYGVIGSQVALRFNIPDDFPQGLLPLKCYIKADGLNPDNTVANQKPMLVVQKDGTVEYVYEATSTGDKILYFRTIQEEVPSPTITNEYFEPDEFELESSMYSITGNVQYFYGHGYNKWYPLSAANKLSVSPSGLVTIQQKTNGKYELMISKEADIKTELTFTVKIQIGAYYDYSSTKTIEELLGDTNLDLVSY